jgi:hypothetical protein
MDLPTIRKAKCSAAMAGSGASSRPRSCRAEKHSARRRLFVIELRQLGHPVGLTDDQPSQLDHLLLQDRPQVARGKHGQVGFKVRRVGERADSLEKRRDRALQRVVHDRQQQFVFVTEVLVDRLFGDHGGGGDLVDAGALVPVAQKQLTARRQDGQPLARRTSQHSLGHGASSDSVLDSLVPSRLEYWTV